MRILRNVMFVTLLLFPVLAFPLQIELAWDYDATPTVAITEFRLYRSPTPALLTFPSAPLIIGIVPTARLVTDSTVAYGTQYCYMLVAANATTESPPSNVVCQTTPLQPPAAVTNLRATIRP